MRPPDYVGPAIPWTLPAIGELRVIPGSKPDSEPYADEDLDLMFGHSVRNILPSRTTPADLPAGTPYSELARMVRAEVLRDFPAGGPAEVGS